MGLSSLDLCKWHPCVLAYSQLALRTCVNPVYVCLTAEAGRQPESPHRCSAGALVVLQSCYPTDLASDLQCACEIRAGFSRVPSHGKQMSNAMYNAANWSLMQLQAWASFANVQHISITAEMPFPCKENSAGKACIAPACRYSVACGARQQLDKEVQVKVMNLASSNSDHEAHAKASTLTACGVDQHGACATGRHLHLTCDV